MKIVLEINGLEREFTEKELVSIVEDYYNNPKPVPKEEKVYTLDDMPDGLSDAGQFYWKQDHGLTSSSQDIFGF